MSYIVVVGYRAFLLLLFCCGVVVGLVREVEILNDNRPHFFITSFGFSEGGHLQLDMEKFMLHDTSHKYEASDFGFFIKISKTDQARLLDGYSSTKCLMNVPPKENEVIRNITYEHWDMEITQSGLYTLFFVNCLKQIISFKFKLVEYNVINGVKSYLSIGETYLPLLFGIATVVYLGMALLWTIGALKGKRTLLNKVHYLMTVVLFFKILAVFSKAVELHYLKVSGNAEGWNISYYIFAFCKGVMLFVVVGLIGMGYTFFKYYLNERDRKILLVVLPLQIIANIAQIESTEGTWGSIEWGTWTTICQIIDIVCCVAVVVPIAYSIKHLKEASSTDGKAARSVEKLQLFRHFYLIVLAYMYFTRIVVVFTRLAVPYTIDWINYFFEEGATIAFYFVTGYKFRPQEDNPYFKIHDEDVSDKNVTIHNNDDIEMTEIK